MAKYLIQDSSLVSIADEVRALSDTADGMTPNAMTTNLQLANAEVSAQTTLLEEALTSLESKTISVVENCSLELTLTNFTDRKIVAVYTYLNDSRQIETSEMEFSSSNTYKITVLKDCQILFMGISGDAPTGYISEGGIYGVRSYNYSTYYAYCFVCTGDSTIEFVY